MTTTALPSARYCYAVWFRHLVTLYEHGLKGPLSTIAEIGPGQTLGVGLCGILTGAETYHATDVQRMRSLEADMHVLDELIEMFQNRQPIPDENEFPEARPRLKSYSFPSHLFPEDYERHLLSGQRLSQAAVVRVRHFRRTLPSTAGVAPVGRGEIVSPERIREDK